MNEMAQPDLVREFLEYRDVLLGFLYSLTRDPDAAEEVLQNVGLAVVAEAGRGTRVADFRRWVREIGSMEGAGGSCGLVGLEGLLLLALFRRRR